jgi:predicted ABC-type transport system involved in lysophospholipase L1 biosynthesis ATPase subunit
MERVRQFGLLRCVGASKSQIKKLVNREGLLITLRAIPLGTLAIILADEPTGNLDTKNSRDVIDLMRLSVERYQQTLIMITHNENYASFADRVLQVVDGTVTELGVGKK